MMTSDAQVLREKKQLLLSPSVAFMGIGFI